MQATHAGLHIETSAERDSRLATTRLTQIERAAPDMLAALQEIIARNEIQHWFNLDQARAAVAKATEQ